MTEPSSERLAAALDEAGELGLAARARRDEFHDFQSPHATPVLVLMDELRKRGQRTKAVRDRIARGEFDADKAESDKWAASPEGQSAARQLGVDQV